MKKKLEITDLINNLYNDHMEVKMNAMKKVVKELNSKRKKFFPSSFLFFTAKILKIKKITNYNF